MTAENDADAVWQFALDFARTSGDSPECQCVSCRAFRAVQCPGCDDPIPTRYRQKGVCGNCYGTTDDPFMPRVIPPGEHDVI